MLSLLLPFKLFYGHEKVVLTLNFGITRTCVLILLEGGVHVTLVICFIRLQHTNKSGFFLLRASDLLLPRLRKNGESFDFTAASTCLG